MLSPKPATPDPERTSFDHPKIGSDRKFGVLFAIVFLALALWPLTVGHTIRAWSLIIAGLFLVAALFSPRFLTVPNKLWFRFGLLLGRFLTPILMSILFLAVIVPIAYILHLLRKDVIRLRPEPALKTYWLPKGQGLTPESLKDQF